GMLVNPASYIWSRKEPGHDHIYSIAPHRRLGHIPRRDESYGNRHAILGGSVYAANAGALHSYASSRHADQFRLDGSCPKQQRYYRDYDRPRQCQSDDLPPHPWDYTRNEYRYLHYDRID